MNYPESRYIPAEPTTTRAYGLLAERSDTIFSTDLAYKVDNSPYQMWSKEISSLGKLEKNWDGYGAIPIYQMVIDQSMFVLMSLAGKNVEKITDIYPNSHGTVCFEWQKSNTEKLVLEIGVENYSYFVKFSDKSPILKDGKNLYADFKKIINHLEELFWEQDFQHVC
jgi:hypothetical protein